MKTVKNLLNQLFVLTLIGSFVAFAWYSYTSNVELRETTERLDREIDARWGKESKYFGGSLKDTIIHLGGNLEESIEE